MLAIALAVVFAALTVVQPLSDLFALAQLSGVQWAPVIGAFAVWFAIMRQTWRYRLIERFSGT